MRPLAMTVTDTQSDAYLAAHAALNAPSKDTKSVIRQVRADLIRKPSLFAKMMAAI